MESSAKKVIRLKIISAQRERLEYLIERFKYIIRNIEVLEPEFEPKSDIIYYTIIVTSQSYYFMIIETLALNGFKIETNDKKVAEIYEKVRNKYKDDLAKYAEEQEISRRINKIHDSIDELIDEGRYSDLIKISKDITYNPESITKAKSFITLSVTNSIIKNIEKAAKYRWELNQTIESLLKIATDKPLKNYNCDQLMEQAGIIAIELSAKNEDSLNYLIKISNMKNIDPLLNIKAAIRLGGILLSNPDKYDSEINRALKELNTRWLNVILDSISNKLAENEIEIFDKFISFLKSKRR